MSKSFKYILTGFVLLIIVGFIAVTLSLDSLVKSAIESTGTELTQTGVTVDDVSLSPFSGSGSIEGMRVRNPEGFESDYAVVIRNFEISVDIGTIFSDTVIVNEIIITEPAISVIQKVPQNNLRMLVRNMESAVEEESEEASQAMLIRHLLVRNAQVTVTPTIGAQPSATVVMDELELQNVGEDGSAAAKQVVRYVTSRVVNEALKAALGGQLDELKDKAKDAVKDIFN